jgi:hypothetical protein
MPLINDVEEDICPVGEPQVKYPMAAAVQSNGSTYYLNCHGIVSVISELTNPEVGALLLA